LVASVTVLIIACPCALGIAAPISVMVGVGRAAQNGVLIRNGHALQALSQLDYVILDKTGTLTQGRPQVTRVLSHQDWTDDEVIKWGSSLEILSEHPLAKAINDEADKRNLTLFEFRQFQAIEGHGVCAYYYNQRILLGNLKLMEDYDIALNSWGNEVNGGSDKAETPIYLAIDQQCVGVIMIADPIKSDSKRAVQQLHQLGYQVVMLSGDHKKTAQSVAQQVGIDVVYAEVLPQHKTEVIQSLQDKGYRCGMVGDGINDAPALAQADVGIALGTGTDIAIASSDISLMGGSLMEVVKAIKISRLTVRNVKQNLVGAFIYNALGIPIAAGILYPFIGVLLSPIIAGAAMALSSLTVVSNANRLRWVKT